MPLLVGFGRVGSLLGEITWRRGFRWWSSKTSRTRVDELRERDLRRAFGNAANEEIGESGAFRTAPAGCC